MTNLEYIKKQSPEWLADKLYLIMDCDLCPAARECALGEYDPDICRRVLRDWLNAERENNG